MFPHQYQMYYFKNVSFVLWVLKKTNGTFSLHNVACLNIQVQVESKAAGLSVGS